MIIKLDWTTIEPNHVEIMEWAGANGLPGWGAALPVFVDTDAERIYWSHIVTVEGGNHLDPLWSDSLARFGLVAVGSDDKLIGDENRPRLVLQRDTPLLVELPASVMVGV
jgi:hypothetical protein